MTLIDIPFIHGQDEKVDPKVAPMGVLKSARNVRRTKDGRWSKRKGYTALSDDQSAGGGDLTALTRVLAKSGELLAIGHRPDNTTERVHSRHPELSRWETGDTLPATTAPTRVATPNFGSDSAKHPDCAITNDHLAVVYDTGTMGRCFVVVYDLITGNIVYQLQVGATSGQERPKVVAVGDVFAITWIDTTPVGDNEVEFTTYNTTTGTANAGAGVIANDMSNASTYYDLAPYSSTAFIYVYLTSTASTMAVKLVNVSNGSSAGSFTLTANGLPTVLGAPNEHIHVAWRDGSDIKIDTFNGNSPFAHVVGPTTLNTDAGNQLMPTIGRADTSSIWVAWSGETAASVDTFTRYRTVSRTAHALGTLQTISGLRLASKLHYTNGQLLAWLVSKSTFDRVYLLYALENAIGNGRGPQTSLARGTAVDFTTTDGFSGLSGTDTVYFAFPRIARGLVSSATPFTHVDYASVELFGDGRFQSVVIGGLLYLSGGLLTVYDGDVYDLGFQVAPVINTLTASNGAGTLTSSSTYQYIATREWHDNAGNRWVSVPSDPVSVTLGAADDTVSVTYARPKASHLKGNTDDPIRWVITHIWRTLANGTIFYRVTDDAGRLDSGDTFGQNTLSDTTPDSTLRSSEILYTQGQRGALSGILEHSPPPPCRYIWTGRDRVIVGGLENRSEVRWSKRFYPGEPINFSDTDGFKSLVPGTVTAVAELDGLWIVFTEREIYAITGEGPDDNGAGSFFAPPQRIPSDVGCIDWRSVVLVPHGLLFQASKDRICLLPRGGSAPVWIGQPVRETLAALADTAEITGAQLLVDQNVVVFTVVDGSTGALILVYDTRTGEWSVDTDNDAPQFRAGATVWDGDLVLATSALVYQQSTAYADTGGDFISLLLETGELRPGGLNSNIRARKVALLGEYRAACTVKLELSVDDGLTYPHSNTWALSGLSTGEQVQLVWRLPVQKFGSCKFRVSDLVNGGSGSTEGIAVNGITIEVDARKGMPRLREAYRG